MHMGRLDDLDLSLRLSRKEQKDRLEAGYERITELRLELGGRLGGPELGPPIVVLFEGWDASGKGGAIKRLVSPLDQRHVRVAQFSAPTTDEQRHHFLWRFWPGLGWHDRVRSQLVRAGAGRARRGLRDPRRMAPGLRRDHRVRAVDLPFWMHISSDEQLKRFERRERKPLKRWKLTDEDWRNREKRPAYSDAVEEMLERTDHPEAHWHLVEGDSKRYARVKVLETVIAEIEAGMRDHGTRPPPD